MSIFGNSRGDGQEMSFLGKGREWIILLISFLVASFVWLIYNLSLPYSVFLDYPVLIKSDIPGYEPSTKSDQRLIIRGKASGFYITGKKIDSGSKAVELQVSEKMVTRLDGAHETFCVPTSRLRKELSAVLDGKVDIEYILTDSLTFKLIPTWKKKVPVRLNASFDCKSQYKLYSSVRVEPDSVYVSGASSLVSSIDAVWTERIHRTGIDENIQAVAELTKINGVELSATSVVYNVDVKRYVEESVKLPVSVRNLPPDRKAVIIPDQVELTFRRWYPIIGMVNPDDFELVIDYESLADFSSSDIVPEVAGFPEGSFDFRINPTMVESIFISK
ncbi:MAG: hypothetical protein KBS57_05565 [Alistipes sp.]|nr:hypothetical protein [Candidatus Minthomonas equi]